MRLVRLRFLINTIEGRQCESIVYNRQILAALEARDGERAERLSRELTWTGCQRLLDNLHLGPAPESMSPQEQASRILARR